MKFFLSIFAVFCVASCSGPGSTELNRPPTDANGTRQLILRTSFSQNNGIPVAWASYRDSGISGFGPGVLITCNSAVIVDTRKITRQSDTGIFINLPSGNYDWIYEGPDTTFEVFMPVQTATVIDSIRSHFGDSVRAQTLLLRTDTFTVRYHPTTPCANLQAILGDNSSLATAPTIFDSSSGVIQSIHPEKLKLNAGSGSIALTKVVVQRFQTSSISNIIVEDSTVGRSTFIQWR